MFPPKKDPQWNPFVINSVSNSKPSGHRRKVWPLCPTCPNQITCIKIAQTHPSRWCTIEGRDGVMGRTPRHFIGEWYLRELTRSKSSWRAGRSDPAVCKHTQSLRRVWLLAIPWTVAREAPLYSGFSRPEYRSGLPFPTPGDLPDSGIELVSPASPALAGRFFTTEPPKEALCLGYLSIYIKPRTVLAPDTPQW